MSRCVLLQTHSELRTFGAHYRRLFVSLLDMNMCGISLDYDELTSKLPGPSSKWKLMQLTVNVLYRMIFEASRLLLNNTAYVHLVNGAVKSWRCFARFWYRIEMYARSTVII